MATWGATNNANTENNSSGRKFSGGTFATPGGTVTDLHVYMAGWAGAESSRWAIYTGGSAGDPTGATLVCDFGEVTTNISATPAWYGMVANFGKTASGSIADGARVWIMCKLADCNVYMTNTDKGDLDTGLESFSVESSSPAVAFPSTWPTDAGTGSGEAMKVYITYTPSGGGATTKANLIKQVSRYHLGASSLGRIQRHS